MFYKFLKITIGTAVRTFFRRIVVLGAENIPKGKPVILVSNHPSAFMDPLVLGIVMERELYYFARADIFSPGIGKWIMEKAHMSPIYRIVDGIDSLEKNDAVFAHGYKLLSENKVLLLFGEGVTDEEFVRRVKSMKKGSMRIGLGAENKYDFKLGVNIICVGINYSDPRKFRSDLLVSFSKPIEVGEYKDLFFEHSNKAMIELNKEIYSRLKEQVIHIENPENCKLFEQLLILTGRGINNEYFNENLSLEERWGFSKQLADKINSGSSEKLSLLGKELNLYFDSLSRNNINDSSICDFIENSRPLFSEVFSLVIMFPVFLVGMVNNYLPVLFSVFLSRKISKRPVFWSGTDMAFSIITVPVYYFILIYFIYSRAGNMYATLFYALLMPVTGLAAFNYFQNYEKLMRKIKFHFLIKKEEKTVRDLTGMRSRVMEEIKKLLMAD